MTNKELFKKIREELRENGLTITAEQVKESVNAAVKIIDEAVRSGDKIMFRGFGSFEQYEYKQRVGTNPSNQEKINIKGFRKIKFKPTQRF